MNSFSERVYEIVEKIPYGKVMSYGQIAWMLGHPKSARAVGQAMSRCLDDLPWHRVVKSDGSIANSMHAEIRKALLKEEGVEFINENKVGEESFAFFELGIRN
ncbi:MGMT family protein [Clostridiaceae bacterium OttesenSCG-928-D20]|nr:MGMT family protein [Clostridiaceae bacterium OttesenSCG-928-D20]